jgi:hypothetical protein
VQPRNIDTTCEAVEVGVDDDDDDNDDDGQ